MRCILSAQPILAGSLVVEARHPQPANRRVLAGHTIWQTSVGAVGRQCENFRIRVASIGMCLSLPLPKKERPSVGLSTC